MENEVKSIQDLATTIKNDINKVETKNTAEIELITKAVDKLAADLKVAQLGSVAKEKLETKSAFELQFETKIDEIKALSKGSNPVKFEFKALGDMFAPVVSAPVTQLAPAPAVTNLRDIIPAFPTTSNSLPFIQEKGFYGSPAMTGEGALKAKVSLDFESKSLPVRKLTAWFHVSTELRDDAPAMFSYIQSRVLQEMAEVENAELAYGDGTGVHLLGFAQEAQLFNAKGKKVKNAQLMDVARLAILQVRRARRFASAILMNPADVAELDLTKDADGNYLLGSLYTNATPSLRSVRIVEQDVIEEGTMYVGDFANAVKIYDRQGVTVNIYDQNGTDAVENMLTVVCEKRMVQVVERPEAVVKVVIADAIAAITKA